MTVMNDGWRWDCFSGGDDEERRWWKHVGVMNPVMEARRFDREKGGEETVREQRGEEPMFQNQSSLGAISRLNLNKVNQQRSGGDGKRTENGGWGGWGWVSVLVEFHGVLMEAGEAMGCFMLGPCLMGWTYAPCISHFLMHDNHTPCILYFCHISSSSLYFPIYITPSLNITRYNFLK